MKPRVAYLVNQYPKVSHSFIRREIIELERRGFEILRIALRGWDGALVEPHDDRERRRTQYVLRAGPVPLVAALLRTFVVAPTRLLRALALAVRLGWRADRPLRYHLAYLAEACRILPWLRAFGATHLHAHFGTNSAEVAMLAHELGGPPYSFTVHGPEEFDKPQFLAIGDKVRRSAFTVAVSSHARSQLYRWIEPAYWSKVKLVRCGLEPGFYDAAPTAPPSAPRLVCVGRLCEQKGQVLLIEALARLAAKRIAFEMILAGDGESRGAIEEMIEKRRLAERVRITGWISSEAVRAQILAARALVLPSFAEGLPVAIMEAMVLGRPVVSTYVAAIPELVRPGENGWLCPPGDPEALAGALEEVLSYPPQKLDAMGQAARRRVLAEHSIEIEAAKLAALLCLGASR